MFWLVLVQKYLVLLLLLFFVFCLIRVHVARRIPDRSQTTSLVVVNSEIPGIRRGKRWILGQETILGRSERCSVVISDPYVSGRHARIFYHGGRYYVTDLGSTNGTILNGQRLTDTKLLKPGAQLQVGRVTLTLEVAAEKKKGSCSLLPFFPGLILAAGAPELYREQILRMQDLALWLVLIIILSISSLVAEKKLKGDPLLVYLTGVLIALGIIFIYRTNPYYGMRQGCWAITGITLFWLVQLFLAEYRRLHNFKYLFMLISIFFLVMTIIFGAEAGGARSWLALGSFRFQPSEFAKILMVIFLAGYLDENKEILKQGTKKLGHFYVPDWPYLGPLLVACGLAMLLLVFQRDLGMALLFYIVFLLMVYVATGRLSFLMLGLFLFIAGAFVMYHSFPHVQERIDIFLNPWAKADSGGYQIIQSLFALASGGIFGLGLGSGFPELIPAVHTDFIFSLIGEELGLLGTLSVIGIYFVLVWRGLSLALNTPDVFGSLLAFGFSSLLAMQALIIVGGVTKIIPLTGIPLPFLSYGGSSFISNCFLIGMLARIASESEAGQGRSAPHSRPALGENSVFGG